MRKRLLIAPALLILLTTITFQEKITLSKFNIKKINIENNFILKENEIKKLLIPVYDKNIFLINNKDIKRLLIKNTFIDSYKIKKKYPNTLEIKIYEKKPIAILINKKKKYFISEKIDLVEFKNYNEFKDLPFVFGKKKEFEKLYLSLNEINFPFHIIKKYTFFKAKRWNLDTVNNKVIKLPAENYTLSLENYLSLKDDKNFKKFKIFDYRIHNQLILK